MVLLSTIIAAACIHIEMMPAIHAVTEALGRPATITSACGGEHMPGSLHPLGYALDFRTRDILKHERPALAEAVSEALGDDYDVILEETHLHVEFSK